MLLCFDSLFPRVSESLVAMDFAGAVKTPPDPFLDVVIPTGEMDMLWLEFQMSDLNKRVEIDELIAEIHTQLTQVLN